jgi:hypothetical protein
MALTAVTLRFAVALTASSGARPRWSPVCAGSCRSARCDGNCAPDDRGWRRPAWDCRTLRTAADFERVVSSVTVTDPHHPLFGQQLKLLSLSCGRGPAYIAVALPDGRRRLMRRAATDLERPLAPRMVLPLISVRTLLPLARHIRSMLASSNEEVCHVNSPPTGSFPAAAAEDPLPIASTTMAGPAGSRAHAVVATICPAASPRSRRGGRPC